jgi:HEAT repeat protein
MLALRGDSESTSLLLAVAKYDPNASVRSEAISFLSRVPGDVGVNALEDMLRTEQDENIQRAVIRSLASSDNAKARASMRALIDRKDASPSLRAEAIRSFNSERATPDDARYLRDLYGRADNDQVKLAIVDALARIGGPENEQWVLGIAMNGSEPSSMRAAALGRLTRSQSVSVASLSKLYDNAESYELRRRVIDVLAVRKEPEATDKLVDIVKNSTVPALRSQAINALTRKNDQRTTQLLMDILDGKRP